MPKGIALPDAEYQRAVNVWNQMGCNIERAADALGVSWSCAERRIREGRKRGFEATGAVSDPTTAQHAEINLLKSRLKTLEAQALSDAYVKDLIFRIAAAPVAVPNWLAVPKKADHALTGTPMFLLSDIHHGEIVRSEEIGGVNEFSVAVSHKRIRTYIQEGVSLLTEHIARPNYSGAVLMLGGDMISGDIHDELSATNELEPMPAVLDLCGTLIWAVQILVEQFGKLHVVGVTGNHGRTSRKPRAKRRNHTNFDWLLYQMLASRVSDKRVTFQIPEGPDARLTVGTTRYLLTHGDQYRGGDGFAGAVVPIARGDKRKRARQSRISQDYDVQVMGHWHNYIHTEDWIVNGSVKGYDEYAHAGNFDPQPPIQALWVTHPKYGMTFRMPVYLDRPKGKAS